MERWRADAVDWQATHDVAVAAPARPPLSLQSGVVLSGKLRLGDKLGEGGMGVVYEATHLLLGQTVAVKLIKPERSFGEAQRARFLREARAVSALRSRHIVRVLDVDTTAEGLVYMVLERLRGETLAEALERGPLPAADVIRLGLQLCEALAEAHAAGVVHRDIKPSNIFLAREGSETVAKLIDFGVARVREPSLAGPLEVLTGEGAVGSLPFSSPEQLRDARSVDGRSDLWSLAITMQLAATGDLPFAADTGEALTVAITADAPRPMRLEPRCPPLERAVSACLVKHRDGRPASADALARLLSGAAPARSSRRLFTVLAALSALLLAPLVGGLGAPAQPAIVQNDAQMAAPTERSASVAVETVTLPTPTAAPTPQAPSAALPASPTPLGSASSPGPRSPAPPRPARAVQARPALPAAPSAPRPSGRPTDDDDFSSWSRK